MSLLLKFLHLLGAAGFIGSLAVQWVLGSAFFGLDAAQAAATPHAVDATSRLLLWPSAVLMVLSGMLLIVARPAYFEARWLWAKVLLLMALVPLAWVGLPAAALALAVAAVALAVWRPRLGTRRAEPPSR